MTDTSEIKQPLPEVTAYFTAVDAAHVAYDKECESAAEAQAKAIRDFDFGSTEYLAATRSCRAAVIAARAAQSTALDAARLALRDSGNEVAVFLAANYLPHYPDETGLLLRALPLTLAEMDELALNEDWCTAYMEARLEMQEDGILPRDDLTPAMARLVDTRLGELYGHTLTLRNYLDLLALLKAIHAEGGSDFFGTAGTAPEGA